MEEKKSSATLKTVFRKVVRFLVVVAFFNFMQIHLLGRPILEVLDEATEVYGFIGAFVMLLLDFVYKKYYQRKM